MASPPADGAPSWIASPWLPFVYAEVVRSPETYGVVILGDKDRDPLLVAHGVIRDEMWKLHHSPRSAASGAVVFRYVETLLQGESERLARIVQSELEKTAGHPVVWGDFPGPPTMDSVGAAVTKRLQAP
ncbi:MAG TPA: hypothetical protein VEY12_03200 [Thermoplasmata archaeon]|nr:hypothetical protein [Thermoplasmata archaeon]